MSRLDFWRPQNILFFERPGGGFLALRLVGGRNPEN
jgi:hypothetical protein